MKKLTKLILGLLLLICGLLGGVYVGLYLCLIGGIVDIINVINGAIRHQEDIEAITVAYSICKVLFSGLAFWASSVILTVPGMALLQSVTKGR